MSVVENLRGTEAPMSDGLKTGPTVFIEPWEIIDPCLDDCMSRLKEIGIPKEQIDWQLYDAATTEIGELAQGLPDSSLQEQLLVDQMISELRKVSAVAQVLDAELGSKLLAD